MASNNPIDVDWNGIEVGKFGSSSNPMPFMFDFNPRIVPPPGTVLSYRSSPVAIYAVLVDGEVCRFVRVVFWAEVQGALPEPNSHVGQIVVGHDLVLVSTLPAFLGYSYESSGAADISFWRRKLEERRESA